jgi:hypothetical protein
MKANPNGMYFSSIAFHQPMEKGRLIRLPSHLGKTNQHEQVKKCPSEQPIQIVLHSGQAFQAADCVGDIQSELPTNNYCHPRSFLWDQNKNEVVPTNMHDRRPK